ncbi:MAG: hypothetical protein GYB65_02145 [Chloroflexi bacterium]|nr:hypothetical protein [Chloroflexota bacterium]
MADPRGQDSDPLDAQIAAIINTLTPAERVGQLMLVTFEGTRLDDNTDIVQLITDYNIGGVILLAENDNIIGPVNTPSLMKNLSGSLQQTAYDAAQGTNERANPRTFVPLFVATQHAGNSQPGTQIAQGTTPLPSYMALGATWNTANARQVGQIAGAELSAMGINMLFGPALDVVQQPGTDRALDLGVDTFGGNPFWVGQMGQAYITGLHEGSQGQIAVIAQNFPGLGFADTQPAEEIPVVPRSIEELSRIDLLPFYAVTGQAGHSLARTDGIQCANIRYLGENIRSTTAPVCVDSQAANQLLELDYFRAWREEGIMVSSPLGTPAIRRYYNATPFPHRQVARAAFLAGNDILYMDNFGPEDGADQLENVSDVIAFFAELYQNDPLFRAQVDTSLRRVLRLKLTLYGSDLSLENVLYRVIDVSTVGQAGDELYRIAQEGVTLIAPSRENLPPPPTRDENIVIFTDMRLVQQCSTCISYPLVSPNALESAIERNYAAGDEIRPERVTSFSFRQLEDYLQGNIEGTSADSNTFQTNRRMGEALRDVDWVVLVMLDVSDQAEASTVVRDFLQHQTELVERAHVVVIALGAPTYLTSTEISKLSAYFGLYSTIPYYIDAAARALFQEVSFEGALPISLPATGYDLAAVTQPDPAQTTQLEIALLDGETVLPANRTPDVLAMTLGQQLIVRTGLLLDHNGNIVPDNTPVEFTITTVTDTGDLRTNQPEYTRDGIAYTNFTANRTGRFQITATSQEATNAQPFAIIVTEATDQVEAPLATVTQLPANRTPTSIETSPENTPAPAPALAAVPTEVQDESLLPAEPETAASPPPGTEEDAGEDRARVALADFFLAVVGLVLLGALGFSAGLSTTFSLDGGLRVILSCLVAGLTGYIYYGVGGPGADQLHDLLNNLAPVITALGAGLVGLVYAWWGLWHHQQGSR